MSRSADTAAHWDSAYGRGEQTLSWYQAVPTYSLKMISDAGLDRSTAVIDIGGGTSRLVDELLDRGFTDLTVLDLSAAAIADAQRRLADRAGQVSWLVEDVRRWRPDRRYGLWHDRAALHFQVERSDRDGYLAALDTGTGPGSTAIFATFAPDGPTQCSGLPVVRYGPQQIAAMLGDDWRLTTDGREHHITPAGAMQSFTWTTLRRSDHVTGR